VNQQKDQQADEQQNRQGPREPMDEISGHRSLVDYTPRATRLFPSWFRLARGELFELESWSDGVLE
jgi:hypothetical protein